jgi:hypothetical protein
MTGMETDHVSSLLCGHGVGNRGVYDRGWGLYGRGREALDGHSARSGRLRLGGSLLGPIR